MKTKIIKELQNYLEMMKMSGVDVIGIDSKYHSEQSEESVTIDPSAQRSSTLVVSPQNDNRLLWDAPTAT